MFEGLRKITVLSVFGIFAAAPSSTNFTLKSYEFGSGGESSTSTNYGLQSTAGEQSSDQLSSTNYKVLSGRIGTQQSNVPSAPTFTNPSNEYNRLRLVVNTGGNPADTLFQVAISTDNFVTTNYVQTDNTIGTTNTLAQYQTYAAWGSAGGVWVVGLANNTTYQVKVRALQGDFTGSAFSPVASAATGLPSLTFSVATSITSTPPYSVGFSSLSAGSIVTASATAELGITTNSLGGAIVYTKGNGALASALAGSSIASANADLSIVASGYGALVSSVSQTSGGPLTAQSPYNGVGNVVGGITTNLRPLVSTATAINTGTASVSLKAKSEAITPAAPDYTDTLTFVSAMLY